MVLEADTKELAPIAETLERLPVETLDICQINTFEEPTVLPHHDRNPFAVLLFPVVFEWRDNAPFALLLDPNVFEYIVLSPLAIFEFHQILLNNA